MIMTGQPALFEYDLNRNIHDYMIDILGVDYLDDKSILDIGCSYTLLRNHIKDKGISINRYVGIEQSSSVISIAMTHFPDVSVIQSEFPALSKEHKIFLISCNFDVVVMSVFLRSVNSSIICGLIEKIAELMSGKIVFDRFGDENGMKELKELKTDFYNIDLSNTNKYIESVESVDVFTKEGILIYVVTIGG